MHKSYVYNMAKIDSRLYLRQASVADQGTSCQIDSTVLAKSVEWWHWAEDFLIGGTIRVLWKFEIINLVKRFIRPSWDVYNFNLSR